ncbi:MAG TPA: phospholipid carrier-dependent glycosyltransferase, partial [Candidatus Acidoferrum sp.]|nr:phospholipid carrier-dependent glycosyltransferase [Candidatus Acidoferrum sp.]
MTETTASIAENPRPSTSARNGWAVLILATLYVCYFSHLGAIGFVGPDEPRYAWIARDMVETGDWVTPRLYGKPWFEKPVLYYWGAALCFKLFGVSEAAARLPSAISALLATLALAWFALRLYGAETARWLLLLLPTTVGMIGFSHAAATDMPFSGMLTIAMVCAAVVIGLTRDANSPVVPQTPWLALILFGFFLGLAVLAKGPAAIILSGGAIFFWALFTKRWRDAFRLFHPAAIASLCLTALPWYILCARRNPDFFRIFIIEHNFKRYLTPEFQHIQPFWFYIPITILALLPWATLAPLLFADAWRAWSENRWRSSPALLFTCWAVLTLVFFSISKSKLPGYVLPAIPPIVLLLTRAASLRLRSAGPGSRWIGIVSRMTIFCIAGATLAEIDKIPFQVDYSPPGPLGIVIVTLGFSGIIASILGAFKKTVPALSLSVAVFLGAIVFSLTGDAVWSLDKGISSRVAASYAWETTRNSPDRQILVRGLPRAERYGLSFYLHRELQEWTPNERQHGWVLTNYEGQEGLRQLGLTCPPMRRGAPIAICEEDGLAD